MIRKIALAALVLSFGAAPAAEARESFQRIAGVKSAGTPAKYDKVGHPQDRVREGEERPRAEPGHVGLRRLLRAAGA